MKIKTQVGISLIIFVALAALIIFSVYVINSQFSELEKKQQIIDRIETSSFDLYYLENDYIVHGGIQPVERWYAKYATLTAQYQELTVNNPSQQAVLNDIFVHHRDLNTSFSNLVAVAGDVKGKEPIGASQELKEFYVSTLAGQMQTLLSRSSELSELVKTEALELKQRMILVISFSIGLLMLFVLLIYLFINRSVLISISALQRGSERVGLGDLDTKIEITSNDELGTLSLAFNDMSTSLKNSRTLLLASNVELERKNQELMAANVQLTVAEKELKSQFYALAESEEKFRGIFDHINDGLHIHEIGPGCKPGKFLEINEVACRMLQYTREELLLHGPLDFVTDYHSRPLDEITGELSTVGHSIFETEHRRKDGTVLPVEVNTHVVTLQGKRVAVGVVRDITERKFMEATLLKVNLKLNVISQLTRKDLSNQTFVLSSYLELAQNQLTGQDPVIVTLQKGAESVRLIQETIEYSKDYQDMGAKPPTWQNVKMTMLFGLSHISTLSS